MFGAFGAVRLFWYRCLQLIQFRLFGRKRKGKIDKAGAAYRGARGKVDEHPANLFSSTTASPKDSPGVSIGRRRPRRERGGP